MRLGQHALDSGGTMLSSRPEDPVSATRKRPGRDEVDSSIPTSSLSAKLMTPDLSGWSAQVIATVGSPVWRWRSPNGVGRGGVDDVVAVEGDDRVPDVRLNFEKGVAGLGCGP